MCISHGMVDGIVVVLLLNDSSVPNKEYMSGSFFSELNYLRRFSNQLENVIKHVPCDNDVFQVFLLSNCTQTIISRVSIRILIYDLIFSSEFEWLWIRRIGTCPLVFRSVFCDALMFDEGTTSMVFLQCKPFTLYVIRGS